MKRIISFWVVLSVFSPVLMAQDTTNQVPQNNEEGIDSVRRNTFLIYPGFGVGLVRNQLSPSFYINIGFSHRNLYEGNINTSTFFFFEKGTDNKHHIHRNTFLNLEFNLNFTPLNQSLKSWNGLGVGYLVEARGSYFSEPAMVFYYKRKFRFFSVMPGIILDDNFKDVWPVISIRL